MNGLFYRKDKQGFSLKAALLKLLKNKRFMVRFVIGSAIVLYMLFESHGIVQRIRLQQQKKDFIAKIQEAGNETKRLQAESKALDGDPKAIEKVAREKHGMIREGETVYRVNKK
jgi:cell division protein FtsB